MRYMMLIYSREGSTTTDQEKAVALRHRDVMNEAKGFKDKLTEIAVHPSTGSGRTE